MLIPILFLILAAALPAQSPLPPNSPVAASLEPQAKAAFSLTVPANQFVHIIVNPGQADVSLSISAPGLTIPPVNRVTYGPEDAYLLPTSPTTYTLTVISESAAALQFQLTAHVRPPTPQTTACAAAFDSAFRQTAALSGNAAERNRQTLALHQTAVPLWVTCGDESWQAYSLDRLGFARKNANQREQAIQDILAAAAIHRRLGATLSLGISLGNAAGIHSELGRNSTAISLFEEAHRLRGQVGDLRGQGVVLNNLASVYLRLSDYANARLARVQSLAIRRVTNDKPGEATVLSNLALLYAITGDLQAALDHATQALAIRQQLNDRPGVASSTVALGRVYAGLGDYTRATSLFQSALAHYEKEGDNTFIATLLTDLALLSRQAGDYPAALRSLQRALQLRLVEAVPIRIVNTYSALCDLHALTGDHAAAITVAATALPIAEKANFPLGIGNLNRCLGRVYRASSDHPRAATHFASARAIFAQAQATEPLAETLTELAFLQRDQNQLPAALESIAEANRITAGLRAAVASPDMRATFRATRAARIHFHIATLMALHQQSPSSSHAADAFQLAESWRARSLVESLTSTTPIPILSASQRQRELDLLTSISLLQRDLLQPALSPTAAPTLKQQLAAREADYELFRVSLRQDPPPPANPAIDLPAARQLLRNPQSAILFFDLAAPHSFAWLLTPTSLHSATLPPQPTIAAAVSALRSQLASPVTSLTVNTSLSRINTASRALYSQLLAPFAPHLASLQSLTIVPDGVLSTLPFDVLTSTQPALDRLTIQYAPSLSTLAALRARRRDRPAPPKALLAFADPDYPSSPTSTERGFAFTRLPNSRQEALGIQSIFPTAQTRLFLGPQASEHALTQESLDSYRYLHFASHGYLDPDQPQRSGILLLPGAPTLDGILQTRDIARLRLNADLVTLSACQSGAGQFLDGEGIMGLSRAFFQAGAQATVVSLWNVNDAATSRLMRAFYQHLKAGLPFTEALHRAKTELRKSPGPWRHPYFWAPFIPIGHGN